MKETMEINVQHWTEVRSLKRPELGMLAASGLVQTCTAKRKKDAINKISESRLVHFDRGYVKNYFLQYFYEILMQEFLVAQVTTTKDELAGSDTKEAILEAIEGFKDFLASLSDDELTGKDSLEVYRAYRKSAFDA